MITYLNKRVVSDVGSIRSRYSGKKICIAIDSSKTNTAIWVMSRTYKGLDLIEFDGSKDKEILDLIKLQRDAIRCIFDGATIVDGGIEDIITKKSEESGGKFSEGLKHHHSRYVITAVFISLISCFQDFFNMTLSTISNQTWKHTVLPKELNRRDIYKGSVDYVKNIYPQYITGGKDDDGADAICIGEYMKIRNGISKDSSLDDIPDEEEFLLHPCKYRLYPVNTKIKDDKSVKFQYNDSLSLDANARAIANRIDKGQLGNAVLDISCVSIEDIYALCASKFDEKVDKLLLVVKRV